MNSLDDKLLNLLDDDLFEEGVDDTKASKKWVRRIRSFSKA
jgi:hypothetical protein